MENCLVTKLKSSVNNNTLQKLGYAIITKPAFGSYDANAQYLSVSYSDVDYSGTILARTGSFYGGATSYTMNGANATIRCDAPAAILDFPDKYKITAFDGRNFILNMDSMSCMSALTILKGEVCGNLDLITADKFPVLQTLQHSRPDNSLKIIGDIANLAKIPTLQTVIFNEITDINGVTGTLANIASLSNLKTFSISKNKNITGNITSLVNNTGLEVLEVNGCTGLTGSINSLGALKSLTRLKLADSNIGGTIEGFVQAQRANPNGRTTESTGITIPYLNTTSITFDGEAITAALGNGNTVLTWDATTITLTLGSETKTVTA